MDAMCAQELQFPALLPREPYEATNRWTEYGDGLFRLKDRKGADYLLGPTHEEMFTLVVKDLYSSYKDLPVWLYQIQTKYRDPARPRAALMRGRESPLERKTVGWGTSWTVSGGFWGCRFLKKKKK